MSQKRVEDRIYSIVNNAGRALVKKLVLVLGSNEIDTINKTDTYGNYKDLQMSKKEHEEKMVQRLELVQKNADGAVITVTTQENAIKKKFGKTFATPFDQDFLKHLVYPYCLKKRLIVRLELNSSEKVIFYSIDTAGR